MLKLLYSPASPFARMVRIVLAEKGLAFEGDEGGATARPIADFAAVNPNLVIPVFYDGEMLLFESHLILEYLLQNYPQNAPDAPAPPLAAAPTRPATHWEDAKMLATINTLANTMVNLRHLTTDGVDPATTPYLRRQQARVQSCLDWLEQRVTPEGFVPGQFSIQDLGLICHLEFAEFRSIFQWRGRPHLEAMLAFHAGRPAVQSTRPVAR